jgi:hypothetical protein
LAGEQRRALVVLEQKGLLSATEVTEVGQGLASGLSGDNSEKYDRIEAVAIAGRCLINLSQYEDCLSLLQPLIHVADDESSAAEITRLLSAARTAGALSSEIVPTVGLDTVGLVTQSTASRQSK